MKITKEIKVEPWSGTETEVGAAVWYDDLPSVFMCELKLPIIQVHREQWNIDTNFTNKKYKHNAVLMFTWKLNKSTN